MQIRGEPGGVTTFEFILFPGDGRLVIVDAIERDQPFQFEQSLVYQALEMEEDDYPLAKK